MELESSKLINIKHFYKDNQLYFYEKDIKNLFDFFVSLLAIINLFIILMMFIVFVLNKIITVLITFDFESLKDNKHDLNYYQIIQNNFCDDFRNVFKKVLENRIMLYNISLNNKSFDMFIYKNFYYKDSLFLSNNSFEIKKTLNMLDCLKYYADKHDYEEDDILIINYGVNIGWYTTIFSNFHYSILSFEPLDENYYLLKKNFCRNNKNFENKESTVTLINKALYPNVTICDFYKDNKSYKNNLILCDKSKEQKLDTNYKKTNKIETSKLSDFIPLMAKRITLLIFDLQFEGEMAIESGKELITKYHIPFIFIEVNMLMFELHETKPYKFFMFFIENGYKISLNGFLNNQFITVDDLIKANLKKVDLYIAYFGK